ncbi:MAG: hydrolase [Candidatus Woesearchaeota archaeon]
MKEEICCLKFNPKPWDGKMFTWKNKRFIKDNVFTLFYMPINFGSVITKMIKKVENAKARTPDDVCLSDHTSMFNMNLYVAVNKEIPNAKNTTLSGKFMSKVYEGPFKNTGKWMEDFTKYAKTKKHDIKRMFMWYTTCPKCAKKYGKNYVVVIGKIQ